jgi:hypothetical protein
MKTLIKHIFRNRLLSAILLMGVSNGALATCSFMDSRFTPNDAVQLNLGSVIVQRDTPVGTVVWSATNNTLGGRNNFIECNATGYRTQWAAGSGYAPVAYSGQTLYQSGVPGLAFRIVTPGQERPAAGMEPALFPVKFPTSPAPARRPGGGYAGNRGSYQLQLVKIAPLPDRAPSRPARLPGR